MNSRQPLKAVVWGAEATVGTLLGGTLLGVLLGEFVFEILPGHRIENPSPVNIALAAIPALGGLLIGGAAWGLLMGRLSGSGESRRMAKSGVLGFAPATFILAFSLLSLESVVAEALEARVPVHRLFSVAFTLCAFLISGISTWAIARGLRSPARAWRLALKVGLASAAAFLLVDLTMEAAGWVVGAPGAAERATMLTVLFSGMLGAGLVGGGLLGLALSPRSASSASLEGRISTGE
jgi:MFS family permease